jgi:hypothetical protein
MTDNSELAELVTPEDDENRPDVVWYPELCSHHVDGHVPSLLLARAKAASS